MICSIDSFISADSDAKAGALMSRVSEISMTMRRILDFIILLLLDFIAFTTGDYNMFDWFLAIAFFHLAAACANESLGDKLHTLHGC